MLRRMNNNRFILLIYKGWWGEKGEGRAGDEEGRRRREKEEKWGEREYREGWEGDSGGRECGGRVIVEGGRKVGYVNDVDVMFVYFNYLFSL